MKQEFLEIIQNRYSCRNFTQEKVSEADLDFILEAGRLSPSSLGLEPWRFYVVQDSLKKQEIAQIANQQSHVAKCGVIIIITARLDFNEYFIKKLKERNLTEEELQKRIKLYQPFVEDMNLEQKLHYAREQTYLALANMSNAAVACGLSSCIIGGFDGDKMDSYLNLGTKEKTSVLLVVGKTQNDEIPPKIRSPKEEVVRFI